ncbi:MAG: DUF126 domain-containing protein [Candidatus Aenigmatarchaeota archaeon]
MKVEGRGVTEGKAEGEVLISEEPIGFYGAVDIDTGEFIEEGHELEGENISGKVLVFPKGKGSTVGSYVLYGLAKNGEAPAAVVNKETETIVATGCILGEIPCVDRLDSNPVETLKEGDSVKVNADDGLVTVRG